MDFTTLSEGQVLDYTVINNVLSNQKELNTAVNSLSDGVPSGTTADNFTEQVYDKIFFTSSIDRNDSGPNWQTINWPSPWAGRIVETPIVNVTFCANSGRSDIQKVIVGIQEINTSYIKISFSSDTKIYGRVHITGYALVSVSSPVS